MVIFVRAIIATYIIAVNVYGFLLIHFQKKESEENEQTTIRDSKLFIAGLVGGAIGIYASMFVHGYRLKSMFLMIIMPILIVMNIYIFIVGFTGDLGFFVSNV